MVKTCTLKIGCDLCEALLACTFENNVRVQYDASIEWVPCYIQISRSLMGKKIMDIKVGISSILKGTQSEKSKRPQQ